MKQILVIILGVNRQRKNGEMHAWYDVLSVKIIFICVFKLQDLITI